jgi:C-terminal processing protease CtpA/Prc
MPPEVVNPPPPPPPPDVPDPPDPTGASMLRIQSQLKIFQRLFSIVYYLYVDPHFNGVDWNAQGYRYDALVKQGYTTEDFHTAMATLVEELKDEHSRFLDPAQVKEEEEALSGKNEFVGIGVFVAEFVETHSAAVIGVFPAAPPRSWASGRTTCC